MVKWGDCDFKELKKFKEKLIEFQKNEWDKFCEDSAKELAARLLRKVIKRTPVGQYPAGSGKVGGTLRRGWTAGGKSNAASYARSLPITKTGNVYQIEIINPVHYASYVEYGHRTVNHKGWVRGRFMLTISEQEIDAQAPKILEKKLRKKLEELFK